MSELGNFRKAKDEFFASHPQSPLTQAQKRTFEGLSYFPENPALRLKVELEKAPAGQEITIETSTGNIQTYQRIGRFSFVVEGQAAQLTIFYNENGYFLPFVDALAGQETYGAGRYLEPDELPDGRFLVDFNLAYNPFCAYNERWSCPLTPSENRLKVPIRAGEKVFGK